MRKFLTLVLLLIPFLAVGQIGIYPQATASGTNTYTATVSGLTSYQAGQRFAIKFTNANTSTSTIAFSPLAAVSLVKTGSVALSSGDIKAGEIKLLIFDGANLQVIGDGGGGGTWGSITGTLPSQTDLQTALDLKANLAGPTFIGTVVLPSTTSVGTISSTEIGYVDGVTSAIQVQIDAKQASLISGTNIKTVNSNSLVGSGNVSVGDIINPMTTAGDVIVGGASGTPTRLAAGSTSGHVLTSNGSAAAPSWQAASGGSSLSTLNTQTGTSYTLVLSDAGKTIEMSNSSANTLTVPLDASVAFPLYTSILVTQTAGATPTTSLTTIVATGGVTIDASANTLVSPGKNTPMYLYKYATNAWKLWNGNALVGAALTKVDDTNVTMTLGGSAASALLNAASITLGWTGGLAVNRGGTGSTSTPLSGTLIFANTGVYSSNSAQLYLDITNTRLGVGTNTTVDRTLHAEVSDASNSAVTNVERITHITSGSPAIGIGTAIEFETETATGNNNEIGARLVSKATSITAASEVFDVIVETMSGGATATERLKVNADGITVTGKFYLSALNTAPANASDTGTTGEIRIDANHIYICVATNTWKRVAIATW